MINIDSRNGIDFLFCKKASDKYMDIYLEKVSIDKKETLYRLLQCSLFEESENDLNEMNDDAIFEYKYLDRYFPADRIIQYNYIFRYIKI